MRENTEQLKSATRRRPPCRPAFEVRAIKIFFRYKKNAQVKNIQFDLSKNEVYALVSKPCTYCGKYSKSRQTRGMGVRTLDRLKELQEVKFSGIDRIDSSLGYISSNVTACCKACNLAKHEMTVEEYINHCQAVVTNWRVV